MRFVLLIPVVLFVVVVIASLLAPSAILGGSFISAVYSPLLVLVLSPFWLAVTVRRLHDIDHSAIWLLVYLVIILGWVVVAGTAVWSYGVIIGAGNPQDEPNYDIFQVLWWSVVAFFIMSVVCVAGIAIMIAICNRPGTVGPNSYGPDPLQPDGGGYVPSLFDFGASETARQEVIGMWLPPDSDQGRPCSQCDNPLHSEARFCFLCGAAV